ncbi:MAG: hypothetical protein A2655_01510 [Candidatus Yanofskybacteria bacterium RIFCSPHIGHO2_01_FULL_43_42]|uniref:TrpR like protein, YerC/YecD n=1 Tax=Candidatus Yanofskybacteria bacterium RIFCSPLOWO2_01_FULL_43_22 TaxID=1802695 RepID=A0A1F8GGQ4_9BACT|nr:MAG: hypothetical protein A2655_01510 [Candidatus Yanofskybacteria bacterium RIFCSPHIGHO2_01_FULL_43_42]OGN13158.1 MAG: hypothetical protein A3D48_02420 [Candidatus Yanofskybacteria bacterium RIFCSPHIGHO2_02_FULL_43_17]OGN24572.1 MAG: hypothetical protein A3A13_00640 [Candidatus Yanofskybacteria bacterium RIFCSPLOWO2_01_FULL_43_22]
MKIRPRKIESKERMKYLDALYTAIESLKSREEVKSFLRDLLTESERIMIGRRIIIAQRLLQDQSYDQIMKEMRVGPDTIMRVHRWLEDDNGGYEKVIKNLEKVFESRFKSKDKEYYDPLSFKGLKRRYPLHFLLFNLFDKLNDSNKGRN